LQELEADGTQTKSHPQALEVAVVILWVLLQGLVYKNLAIKPV
jgi:hypothetical protein